MENGHDKLTEQYRRNFHKIYHTHIFPILEKYEQERVKKVGLIVVIAIITAILALGVFGCSAIQKNEEFGTMLIFVAVAIAGAGCFIIFAIRDHFVKNLKKSCLGHIIRVFGNLSWTSKLDLISDQEVYNSELFDSYNRRTSDDSFTGEYKGVNFKICETHMWTEEGSGDNSRVIQVFHGVLVKFDFNKSINSKTIIRTKGDAQITSASKWVIFTITSFFIFAILTGFKAPIWIILLVLGIVGVLFLFTKNTVGKSSMSELKLEDPEFNKHYQAYSTDQVEGRYLITPAFMERFKHIQTAFEADEAKCAFYDSHILFALSTSKNLFEVGGLCHTLKDPKQMEEFFNELTSIMRLIDRFKLTEHTGL